MRSGRWLLLCLLAGTLFWGVTGCQTDSGDPTPTPSADPTQPTVEPTEEPTATPTAEPTKAAGYDYEYPKDAYSRELAVFGKWSDNFAPGERTSLLQTSYNEGTKLYTTVREEFRVEGVRTYASVDRAYTAAMHVNVDAYHLSSEYMKEYQAAGYALVGSMGSFNKTAYSNDHPEVLQCDENGDKSAFWNSVVLTDKLLSYNVQNVLRFAVKKATWQVGLCEPEMFRAGCFSQAFKELWELKYAEDFVSPYDNVTAMFMSQRLSVWTHSNAIQYYVSELVKKEADFDRFTIAPHSTLAYATIGDGVTDGYVHMMGTGLVRSVTGQTWSNTMEAAIRYAGKNVKDPFVNGIVDYGTYLDAADYYGADFFALCDPMSDTAASTGTEDYWRSLCHMQLVASLMYPEINRWELIWTNRSFMNVSSDYRSEQLNIHNALLDISGKSYRSEGGTTGITYLLSDTLTWQSDACAEWGGSAYNGFWGVVSPLVYDGILPRTRAMELVTSAEDLEGVKLLIVSYDNQKPLYPEVNTAIAEWVKAGGTLLCLGGPDAYLDVDGAWWADAEGGSPVGNLLACLGIDVTAQTFDGKKQAIAWENTVESAGNLNGLQVGGDAFTYRFSGTFDTEIVKSASGAVLGFETAVGAGHAIFCGVSTANLSDSAAGAELLRALVRLGLTDAGERYVTSDVYMAERGDYVALYPLTKDYTLFGSYVNIFSSTLEIAEDPTVKAGEAALYYHIEEYAYPKVPTVLYAGGVWKTVAQTAGETVVSVTAADNACVPIRILAPAGVYPASVKVAMADGSLNEAAYAWDGATSSLLVQVYAKPNNAAVVTVSWGDEEGKLTARHFESVRIPVNSAGQDKAYIVSNTGSATGSYRYTDRNAEIVWKFDVSEYEGLQLAIGLINNYVIEASADGRNWTELLRLTDISNVTAAGTNEAVMTVAADNYTSDDGILYIRLHNTNPEGGWGGAVRFFDFQYLVK